MNGSLILDFDSTIISVETLDILAEIACKNTSNLQEIKQRISHLTNLSMSGQYSFHEALVERVKFLELTKQHIDEVTSQLKNKITTSFYKHRHFIQSHAENIYVFSGGFTEVITPIMAEFQLSPKHIYANEFIYENDKVIGINTEKLMAHGDGKLKQLSLLNPTGPVYVMGDGSTDAIMKNTGLVDTFFLFAENVYRETVAPQADKIIYSFDEFLNHLHTNQSEK